MKKILVTLFTFFITNVAFSHTFKFTMGEAIISKKFSNLENTEDLGEVISDDNLTDYQKNVVELLKHLNLRQTKDFWSKSFQNHESHFLIADSDNNFLFRMSINSTIPGELVEKTLAFFKNGTKLEGVDILELPESYQIIPMDDL